MELYYAFLKNNRIELIGVFAEQDQTLADAIVIERGFDNAVWTGETLPPMYATFDGEEFTKPTDEYLLSIGVKNPDPIEPIESPTLD